MVMRDPKTIPLAINSKQEFHSFLDDIVRVGARKMLLQMLEFEVESYVQRYVGEVDAKGNRRVVRNGYGKERSVTTGCGDFDVRAPRVDDRREGEKFNSLILPPYLRRSPKVENLLPMLYLKGISTGSMADALRDFLGEGSAGISATSIVKLKAKWDDEFEQFRNEPIEEDIVYIWADGVNVRVRLGEDDKICLLVVIGATVDGKKKLLAVHPGYRESEDSWACVLSSLIARGLKNPLLAIGDGALGFWKALRASGEFLNTKEQRCWVHKIANVLDKLPKRNQADAKQLLHDMMNAETMADAEATRARFVELYEAKFPKAVDCLVKDWSKLTTFFSYPAENWESIRTTNPIESPFSVVKARTRLTKGAGNAKTAATMAFKLLRECEKRWHRIRGHEQIKKLRDGIEFENGIMIQSETQQGAAS
jgi:putative transposase